MIYIFMGCNNFPSLNLEAYVQKQKLMASNVCLKGLLIQKQTRPFFSWRTDESFYL